MVKIEPTTQINVEELKSLLLKQKTTKARFKYPCTESQAEDILKAAYQAEVEYRRRIFVGDEQTANNIKSFATFLTSEDSKFGVLFCGICGNGKTTLLLAFQNATNYLNNHGFFENDKVGISIVDAKDISLYARDHKSFHSLRCRDMLAIEDLGREPTEVLEYGNVLNPVIDLLEYRYNNQLFTLITTNLQPKEIREKYGNRIADRFNEMFDKIIFNNKTYRV